MELGNKTWFVRVDGKVRGPFNANVINSMKDRGRITPSSELSNDRRAWYPGYEFSDLFNEPVEIQQAISAPSSASATSTLPAATGYFYNDQGVQTGPVTIGRLQELAAAGVLTESDLVWFEGAPDWFPASGLSELTFTKQTQTVKKWIFQNKVLACIAAAALLVAVIMPIWYILQLNSARSAELRQKSEQQTANILAAELIALRKEKETLDERLDSLSAQEDAAHDAMANGGIDARKKLGEILKNKKKVQENIRENEDKQAAKQRVEDQAREEQRLANKGSNLITTIIGTAATFLSALLGVAYMIFRASSGRRPDYGAERDILDARREITEAKREITDAIRELKK